MKQSFAAPPIAVIMGGGDIASGTALRLHRGGLRVLVTELDQPKAIRRLVAFAEAIYADSIEIEGVIGRHVSGIAELESVWERGEVAVFVDENADSVRELHPLIVVDGRMIKRPPEYPLDIAPLVVGLGPGFVAGETCHAVIETNRGHTLGRVIWQGSAEADTGIPESVLRHQADRVIRSPGAGIFQPLREIGTQILQDDAIARVGEDTILAPFDGVVRGLLHGGIPVTAGLKVGDIDPRNNPSYARMVSDKALAVAGGVLEVILTLPEIRSALCG